MLDFVLTWDRVFFLFVNHTLSNGFFDVLLPFMRNSYVWVPLYVLIIAYFIWKFKWHGSIWVAWAIVTVSISDIVSSQLIKKAIMRARPCHIQDEIGDMVLRVSCGTGYSFTSSHATNHMALATFVICTTAICWKGWRWWFLPWAIVIGFAQIYVGVHYPFDVVSGFLLGAIVGGTSALVYQKSRWRLVGQSA